jgi:hypothetical protein
MLGRAIAFGALVGAVFSLSPTSLLVLPVRAAPAEGGHPGALPLPDTETALRSRGNDITPVEPPASPPRGFLEPARMLSRVAACGPTGDIPARFDRRIVEAHCRTLHDLEAHWRGKWLARAQPFFERVVPANLPTRIVYPFGGGDLLTVLVVFPAATDITTLSLEPAGDARAIERLGPQDLAPILAEVRAKVNHLFELAHSKTIDMGAMARSKIPGDLTYALAALAIHDMELVSVKYFRLGPRGELHYLTEADVEAADAAEGAARRSAFEDLEIEFQPRSGGPRRVFRHIAANLDDTHLRADPSVLRYLESKGPVTAITKAASYLLWWKEFSTIRDYLLSHMVWMVSDSTGISPEDAEAAGFEQVPYGRFDGPFFRSGTRATELFLALWAAGAAPLSFRFGYPDNANHNHLLVTRPRVP